MNIDAAFQGSLFASDFLCDAITRSLDWQELDDASLEDLEAALRAICDRFPAAVAPNESQTEDDLIWPVLARLGWTASLRQQNLSAYGRVDVPDGLLFADEAAKGQANGFAEEWRRYELGLAVVESKRWQRPLDRRSGRHGEETAPSTQMLRYLRRIDDVTTGSLRWGVLTNGARWRLYYQGARSVSEQFFEVDLAALLDLPGHNDGLFALTETERRHWLKVFALVFRREAFLPGAADARTFHQRAIAEGRFTRSALPPVCPIWSSARSFPSSRVRSPRLSRTRPCRRCVRPPYSCSTGFSSSSMPRTATCCPSATSATTITRCATRFAAMWAAARTRAMSFAETLRAIGRLWPISAVPSTRAKSAIGLPPYNGGLFDRTRAPLLDRIRLGDRVMADVIDALSFEQGPAGRRYINYRDLGVRQLGSIYERLLEHELAPDGDGVAVRPNIFARKGSGSYYTPDDLVGLIVEETIGPLVQARTDAFEAEAGRMPADGPERERAVARLAALDPAEKILELKVCDPAMGSGHFLVSLVDYLADGVIAAMAEAEALAEGYVSPLVGRIQAIRDRILANAEDRNWAIDRDRLDDRHIVRRMVLKRCVYGVDKNPMAVELAKVALWLHTFTVGAPLSFLDHHLRCGDSLFGAWARSGIDKAAEYGGPLLLHGSIRQAELSALEMRTIEELTDAEIAEAHRSAETFAQVEEATAPLDAVLSLVHAIDWLAVRDREARQRCSPSLAVNSAIPSRSRWAGQRSRRNGRRAPDSLTYWVRPGASSTRNASSTGRRPSPASGRIGKAWPRKVASTP